MVEFPDSIWAATAAPRPPAPALDTDAEADAVVIGAGFTGLSAALELARNVAARAPHAVKLAKSAVNRAQDGPLAQGLEFERNAFYLLFGTDDQKEGIRAFLEKRDPEFKGS